MLVGLKEDGWHPKGIPDVSLSLVLFGAVARLSQVSCCTLSGPNTVPRQNKSKLRIGFPSDVFRGNNQTTSVEYENWKIPTCNRSANWEMENGTRLGKAERFSIVFLFLALVVASSAQRLRRRPADIASSVGWVGGLIRTFLYPAMCTYIFTCRSLFRWRKFIVTRLKVIHWHILWIYLLFVEKKEERCVAVMVVIIRNGTISYYRTTNRSLQITE